MPYRPSKKYSTVNKYLADCLPEVRRALQAIRRTVKASVPGITERISYGVPYYSNNGFVTAFSAQMPPGSRLSLYATPSVVKILKNDLRRFHVSGGTVHFTVERPLPVTLVRKIIRARLKLNAERRKHAMAAR